MFLFYWHREIISLASKGKSNLCRYDDSTDDRRRKMPVFSIFGNRSVNPKIGVLFLVLHWLQETLKFIKRFLVRAALRMRFQVVWQALNKVFWKNCWQVVFWWNRQLSLSPECHQIKNTSNRGVVTLDTCPKDPVSAFSCFATIMKKKTSLKREKKQADVTVKLKWVEIVDASVCKGWTLQRWKIIISLVANVFNGRKSFELRRIGVSEELHWMKGTTSWVHLWKWLHCFESSGLEVLRIGYWSVRPNIPCLLHSIRLPLPLNDSFFYNWRIGSSAQSFEGYPNVLKICRREAILSYCQFQKVGRKTM